MVKTRQDKKTWERKRQSMCRKQWLVQFSTSAAEVAILSEVEDFFFTKKITDQNRCLLLSGDLFCSWHSTEYDKKIVKQCHPWSLSLVGNRN